MEQENSKIPPNFYVCIDDIIIIAGRHKSNKLL